MDEDTKVLRLWQESTTAINKKNVFFCIMNAFFCTYFKLRCLKIMRCEIDGKFSKPNLRNFRFLHTSQTKKIFYHRKSWIHGLKDTTPCMICRAFRIVVENFENISQWNDSDTSGKAHRLQSSMLDGKFIIIYIMSKRIWIWFTPNQYNYKK